MCLTGLPGGSNTVFDRSPYGNNGTVNGAVWKQTAGGIWCLSFDGIDDYVSIDAGRFDGPAQATIELWYRPNIDLDQQANYHMLWSFYKDLANRVMGFYHPTLGTMAMAAVAGGVTRFECGLPAGSNLGESQDWHHWVTVFGCFSLE